MPLHPKIVHLPIALAILMPLVSLAILGGWWRGLLPRRAWLLVAGFQALLVLSGVAASRTGERDEEAAEQVVPEAALEAHEEAAEAFLGVSAAVLALAILAAAARRERPARALAAATFAGTLAVLALGYQVGEAGGRLVYEHGAASAWTGRVGHTTRGRFLVQQPGSHAASQGAATMRRMPASPASRSTRYAPR